MKKAILLFSLLISAGCFAQTDVSVYMPGKSADGVTYALPKSVIEIEVNAIKTQYTPGEFCKYADRYLRLTGISNIEETSWKIGNIKVSSVGIPDPDNTYFIKLKDKSVAPFIGLTEEGLIESINVPAGKKTVSAQAAPQTAKKKLNPRDFMTEEILMASSSAKMAELVAKEIYNIRESKNAIVRGQADNMPKDGESLKLMLANLEEQEQAMLQMFTGTTDREVKTFKLRVTPNGDIDKQVTLRFSKKLGVVANDDLAGAPIYISLTNLKTVTLPDEKSKKDNRKVDGIIYNVPGQAQVKVFSNNEKFFEGELPIVQFGNQESLEKGLFNKNSTIQVVFYPETGAIKNVSN